MIFFLIDDDEIFHFITKRTLRRINSAIELESYKDGEEGIEGLKARISLNWNIPDIILLDINMPFMNGWMFMDEYKKFEERLNKRVQIYMLTSSDDPEDVERAKKISELSGYMVKPVTEEELEVIIRKFPLDGWYQPNT